MNDFGTPADQPGDYAAAGVPVYRDSHETSLTLTVLGGVLTLGALAELVGNGGNPLFDWPMTMGLAIAFTALWLTFGRRAMSRGLRRPPGFGIAAIICLAATVPPLVVLVVYAGPFLAFGVGLAVAGLKLRNRTLTYWALSVGAFGVFEGFFGITNRLGPGIWTAWEHPAIYLLLGAVTLIAGISIRIRVRDEAH